MRALSVSNLILLTIALMLRPAGTRILPLPLSALGEWKVFALGSGVAGLIFFDLSILLSAVILFRYQSFCRNAGSVPHGRAKALLGLAGAAGYLIMIFPNDVTHPIHVAGSALAVGCTWGLMIPYTLELASSGRKGEAWRMQVLLQATVLPYAAAYLAGSPHHPVYQKIAIPGLMAAVLLSVRGGGKNGKMTGTEMRYSGNSSPGPIGSGPGSVIPLEFPENR